jgi:hypothetical protein
MNPKEHPPLLEAGQSQDFLMTETAARGPRKAGDVVSTKHYPEAK